MRCLFVVVKKKNKRVLLIFPTSFMRERRDREEGQGREEEKQAHTQRHL